MVLRARKRRVFLARRADVRPVADTRRHAANGSATRSGLAVIRLFRRRFGFQAARFHVLVSRGGKPADACRVRRQPVCQTNRYRTPRPPATPQPAARRRAPHTAGNADLVRLFCVERRNRRRIGMAATV